MALHRLHISTAVPVKLSSGGGRGQGGDYSVYLSFSLPSVDRHHLPLHPSLHNISRSASALPFLYIMSLTMEERLLGLAHAIDDEESDLQRWMLDVKNKKRTKEFTVDADRRNHITAQVQQLKELRRESTKLKRPLHRCLQNAPKHLKELGKQGHDPAAWLRAKVEDCVSIVRLANTLATKYDFVFPNLISACQKILREVESKLISTGNSIGYQALDEEVAQHNGHIKRIPHRQSPASISKSQGPSSNHSPTQENRRHQAASSMEERLLALAHAVDALQLNLRPLTLDVKNKKRNLEYKNDNDKSKHIQEQVEQLISLKRWSVNFKKSIGGSLLNPQVHLEELKKRALSPAAWLHDKATHCVSLFQFTNELAAKTILYFPTFFRLA